MSRCVKDGSGVLVGGKAIILKFCGKSHRNCSSETTDSRSGYAVFGHCFTTGVGRCGKRVRPLIPRVLSCLRHGWPSILTWTLPPGSSSLPEGFGRAALKRLLLGLAPDEACHAANCHQRPGGLLHRRFTLTYRSKPIGGLFSAALSLRSPWADVIRHRALWSPEVPQPTDRSRPSRGLKCTMIARKRTKGKSKKTLLFSCVNFSVKSQCCGYNVDYRTAKQLFGPYIAGNTA